MTNNGNEEVRDAAGGSGCVDEVKQGIRQLEDETWMIQITWPVRGSRNPRATAPLENRRKSDEDAGYCG